MPKKKEMNTIKGCHFKIRRNALRISNKLFTWHIPAELRSENIKKGDMVRVETVTGTAKVIVAEVFREEPDKADGPYSGGNYRIVIEKLESM